MSGSYGGSFNSATNNDQGSFVLRNHFSSFPSVHYRRPGGDVRRESQSFLVEPVFLIPSGAGWPPQRQRARPSVHFFLREPVFLIAFGLRSAEEARRQARAVVGGLFSHGTAFPHSPNSRSVGSVKPNDRAFESSSHVFVPEPLFLIPSLHGDHRPPVVPQPSAKSWLHGDIGILAVQKMDASVLRFPPPTS